MLVLSRKKDESIMFGDDIVVTIVDIRGDKVRLGIEAPKEVPVHRMEVYQAIQKANREASEKVFAAIQGPSQEAQEQPEEQSQPPGS